MPIDLAEITRGYRAVRAANNRLAGSFMPLGPWLAERLAQLQMLEPRTRAFPVFAFEGRAITARTAGAQQGAISNYGSVGAAIAAPFAALGRGFIRVGQAATDEWILPNLVGAIRDIITAIETQIAAIAAPSAALFDPRNARAGQIFGLAGLAWRAIVSSTRQLRALAGDVAEVRALLGIAPPAPRAAGAPGAPGGPAEPAASIPRALNGEPIDVVTRYIVAALIVVPAIPDLIGSVVRAVWAGVRLAVLLTIQAIEAKLFAVRRQVLDWFFHTLPRMLPKVPAMMTLFGVLIGENIQHFLRFAQLYFALATDILRDFLGEVRTYLNHVIGIINTVLAVIDTILNFDLLLLLRPALGPSAFILDYFGIRFTLNDLLDVAGTAIRLTLYASLQTALFAARNATALIPGSPGRAARRAVRLVGQIIDALFSNTGPYPGETAAPRLRAMPNLYDTVIGSRGATLGDAVAAWGASLAGDIAAIIGVGTQTLTGLGETFAASAADFARTGPRTERFAREAADSANLLFDDQVRALGKRQAATAPGAIERWLAAGGFEAIGAAIPVYVQAMRRFWRDEVSAGRGATVEITPTSPHILARRAVLGRVHFARLEIRTSGRTIDEALVRETAERFQRAVRDAYGEGQRRLAQAAAG